MIYIDGEDARTRTSLAINYWPNSHTLCNRRSSTLRIFKTFTHGKINNIIEPTLLSIKAISSSKSFWGWRLIKTSSRKNDQYVDDLSGHPLIHQFYALWPKSKMQKTSKPEISWLSRPLEKASMEVILPQCSC